MSFTVYRSSAGSGKTFTLVREYLKMILLEPRDFRRILAITFTNKAAAEMKERVLHALRELSVLPESSDTKISHTLLRQLSDQTGLSQPEIAERSARVLRLILHNYSDFTIGTIDSFSHRVIRSFAHDFGLPVQFNVEMDATEMLTSAVDLLLERVGTDEELTRFLVRFLEVRLDEDKGWNIDRILVEFAQVLLDEEGQEHIASLRSLSLSDFSRIAGVIHSRVADFEKRILKIGNDALGVIAEAGLQTSSFYRGNQGISKYFEYLAKGRFDKIQPNSYVLVTIDEDKWAGSKATHQDTGLIEVVKPRLLELFLEACSLLEKSSEKYMLNKLLAKTIYPVAVLNEIDHMLTAFKKQSNIIHISEFNRRISSIVMNEPVPFIYERLGERYQHLMIDEFQDTSRLQWQNFIPLLENSLASGYFNLVVGDGKQAIYRFRNGDVTQFSRLPKLEGADRNPVLNQRQQILEANFSKHQLKDNFRSKSEIVEFNNLFFAYIATLLDEQGKSVYEELKQDHQPEKKGGYLEINILGGQDDKYTFAELNHIELFKILEKLTRDGFSPKDIAILCRNNKQASSIARALSEKGIDVVSSESLLLSQSPEINFLIAFIRFLFEQENPVNQAEIAAYLVNSGRISGESWPEILKKIATAGSSGWGLIRLLKEQGWDLDRELLLTLPLYDLCESLIRTFQLNREANAYLQFFLDAVLTYMKHDKSGAGNFMGWWETKKQKLSVVIPEGLDAVHIMTIHKSKGLQFPVVIFPFADERKKLTKDYLWADLREQNIPGLSTALLKTEAAIEKTAFREQYLEEERKSMLDLVNLLYVVMTRPEERLYILTSTPPVKKETVQSLPSFFAGFLEKEGLYQPDKTVYTFGIPEPKRTSGRREKENHLVLQNFISDEWRNKIKVKSRAPWNWDSDIPGKVQFGNQVHQLLAKITSVSEVEKAMQEAVRSGIISTDELTPIRQILDAIFSHPEIGKLYTEGVKVKTEPGILIPDGAMFRPDRVVFDNGNPVIVEYKTGIRNESHINQLNKYGNLLLEMGYSRVDKYLVYLHNGVEVVKLD